MLSDPKFWVAVAFVAFIGLFIKFALKSVLGALDGRAARIGTELSEAEKLRKEAEEVLALYKQKYRDSIQEAESIIAKARSDADRMTANAQTELKAALDIRMKNALEKIAQEETRAVQEVRAHVIDITIAAARELVTEHMGALSQEDMLRHIISDIERKVH